MLRLSDVISKAVNSVNIGGRIDTKDAVSEAKSHLDGDMRDLLVVEALSKRIKQAVCKLRRNETKVVSAQHSFSFPDLRYAYALDIDGQYIKDTDQLSQLEFCRLIEIREKQLADDSAHLAVLRKAYDSVLPFWETEMVFGEVESAYRQAQDQAA